MAQQELVIEPTGDTRVGYVVVGENLEATAPEGSVDHVDAQGYARGMVWPNNSDEVLGDSFEQVYASAPASATVQTVSVPVEVLPDLDYTTYVPEEVASEGLPGDRLGIHDGRHLLNQDALEALDDEHGPDAKIMVIATSK